MFTASSLKKKNEKFKYRSFIVAIMSFLLPWLAKDANQVLSCVSYMHNK